MKYFTLNFDACASSPCTSGGTCSSDDCINITCSCSKGFTGAYCEAQIGNMQFASFIVLNTYWSISLTKEMH